MKILTINDLNLSSLNEELINSLRNYISSLKFTIFKDEELPLFCKSIQNYLSNIDKDLQVFNIKTNEEDEIDENGTSVAIEIRYKNKPIAIFDDIEEPKYFNPDVKVDSKKIESY